MPCRPYGGTKRGMEKVIVPSPIVSTHCFHPPLHRAPADCHSPRLPPTNTMGVPRHCQTRGWLLPVLRKHEHCLIYVHLKHTILRFPPTTSASPSSTCRPGRVQREGSGNRRARTSPPSGTRRTLQPGTRCQCGSGYVCASTAWRKSYAGRLCGQAGRQAGACLIAQRPHP